MTDYITAIIGAIALLSGYVYQKNMERKAEIRKTQQKIYSRLVANITKRNAVTERILQTPEYKNAKSDEERIQVYKQDPEYYKNFWIERAEIVALLCMYGTDKAIQAYSDWTKKDLDPEGEWPDLGELVVILRQDIIDEKRATANDANLSIWQDPKYLKQSSQAK